MDLNHFVPSCLFVLSNACGPSKALAEHGADTWFAADLRVGAYSVVWDRDLRKIMVDVALQIDSGLLAIGKSTHKGACFGVI